MSPIPSVFLFFFLSSETKTTHSHTSTPSIVATLTWPPFSWLLISKSIPSFTSYLYVLHVRILMCAQYVCGCVCAYVPIYAYVCLCGCIHSGMHVWVCTRTHRNVHTHSMFPTIYKKEMFPPLLEQLTRFSVHTNPFLSLGLTPGYLSFQTNWILNFAPLPHIFSVTPMQFLLLTSLFTCSIRYEKSKIPIQRLNRYAPPPFGEQMWEPTYAGVYLNVYRYFNNFIQRWGVYLQ